MRLLAYMRGSIRLSCKAWADRASSCSPWRTTRAAYALGLCLVFAMAVVACGDEEDMSGTSESVSASTQTGPEGGAGTASAGATQSPGAPSEDASTDADTGTAGDSTAAVTGIPVSSEPPSSRTTHGASDDSDSAVPGDSSSDLPSESNSGSGPDTTEDPTSDGVHLAEAAEPCDAATECPDDYRCVYLDDEHQLGVCSPTCETIGSTCGFYGAGTWSKCILTLEDGTNACGFLCVRDHGDHVHTYTCPSGDWGRLRCERTARIDNHRFCAPRQP